MQAVKTEPQEVKKPLPKLSVAPCNTYLLCRKVDMPDMIGSIAIPDKDKWQKRFEVVATAPDLISYLDKYSVGDILIYPLGAPTMYIQIDGDDYYFLDKKSVVSKI